MSSVEPPITRLLHEAARGNQSAQEQLFLNIESELRIIARRILRQEIAGHLLQPTVLIDDAFLQLIGRERPLSWQDRSHFFRTAARAMRKIACDDYRARAAKKRDARLTIQIASEEMIHETASRTEDLAALDDALERLRQVHPRMASVVELHHFGGHSMEVVAQILEVSPRTVKNDWRMAKAWLHKELTDDGSRE